MSTEPPRRLSISEAAERSGLSADTLRYYERIGLIDPVPRSTSGQRVYGAVDLERLELINRLRGTGMPIQGMLEYARLIRGGPETMERRRGMLAHHRAQLRAEVDRLESTMSYLDRKIGIYDGQLSGGAANDGSGGPGTGGATGATGPAGHGGAAASGAGAPPPEQGAAAG